MTTQHTINPHGGVVTTDKLVAGVHTTVTAADEVTVIGVRQIVSAVATLRDDPSDDPLSVSCEFSDTFSPNGASVLTLKTWRTDGSDPTPLAATTFSKQVCWQVVGI